MRDTLLLNRTGRIKAYFIKYGSDERGNITALLKYPKLNGEQLCDHVWVKVNPAKWPRELERLTWIVFEATTSSYLRKDKTMDYTLGYIDKVKLAH